MKKFINVLLYKLFLHQTATNTQYEDYDVSCFINCFYIKPQLTLSTKIMMLVAL